MASSLSAASPVQPHVHPRRPRRPSRCRAAVLAAGGRAEADFGNKQSQAARRLQLTDLATTPERKEQYVSASRMAQANVEQQKANLDKARIDLERTETRSPVNGWVTNLLTQEGTSAGMGQNSLSLVDADSYWVDGDFEETSLAPIREGDPARIWLLGHRREIAGHVDSIARRIVVSNAQPGQSGHATVNPIFTWVRLAQRVPVRIHIDAVPPEVRLVAGMAATVEVDPRPEADRPPVAGPAPAEGSETGAAERSAPAAALIDVSPGHRTHSRVIGRGRLARRARP